MCQYRLLLLRVLALVIAVTVGLTGLLLPRVSTLAASPSSVPADLAAGYQYVSSLPLVSPPVQAVYMPPSGQLVGLDDSGNLTIYQPQGGQLAPVKTLLENDPGNLGPDLVSDPQSDSVYWINTSANTIEAMNLASKTPAISVVAKDSQLPLYLTVGPSGQHLYVVDQGSTGSGDIAQLSLTNPAAGFTRLSLNAPASAPAAVYQTATGPIAFVPTTFPLNGSANGAIMRADFSASPHSLSAIADNLGLPASVGVSPQGALAVAQEYSTSLAIVPHPTAPTPTWLASSPAAPDQTSSLPGSLQIGVSNQVSVLGQNAEGSPLWMVYSPSQGHWSLPSLPSPQGPLSAAQGTLISPTNTSLLDMLTSTGSAQQLTLANVIPGSPLILYPGSTVQMATAADGSLWVPEQSGAVKVNPRSASLSTSVADAFIPSGGLALTKTGVLALTDSNPPGIFQQPGQVIGPPPGSRVPIAVAAGAPGGGYWALLAEHGNPDLWSSANNQLTPLSANYSNVIDSAYGPILAGGGSLNLFSSATVLKSPAFTGPLALSADGSLAMASAGPGNGLALVNIRTTTLLGTVSLPTPTLPSGSSLGPLADLAVSPHGSWLYGLTANALLSYRGPQLALSASSLTPPINSEVTLTASLTASQGQAVAGQLVTFSTGQTATTNSAGKASVTLRVTEATPLRITASAPAVIQSLTLQPTASPSPTSKPPTSPSKSKSTSPTTPQSPAPVTYQPPGTTGTGRGSSESSKPPAKKSPAPASSRWDIQFHRQEANAPLKVNYHPSWTMPRPPGTRYLTFQVTSGKLRRYPAPYQIEVSTLKGDRPRPYGLWYFSQTDYRWFPLLPYYHFRGTLVANLPFLTVIAVTSKPDPTTLAITRPTAVALSLHMANAVFPNFVHHAVLADPKPITKLSWAASQALAQNRPLLLLPAHHITGPILGTIAMHQEADLTMVEPDHHFAEQLDQRGFTVRTPDDPGAASLPALAGSTPHLWFAQVWWTPARLSWLDQIQPHLVPNSTLTVERSTLSRQLDLIRELHLPSTDNPCWLSQLLPKLGHHGIVTVVGPQPARSALLAKALAAAYRIPILVTHRSAVGQAMRSVHLSDTTPFSIVVDASFAPTASVRHQVGRCWHRRCRIPIALIHPHSGGER